jgi:exodeoxyribonuclease VII large subunit
LYARFELLKQKLKDAGYFDPARKRAIPESPTRVAVITSSRGAAIRDFIRVASDRGTGAQIRVYDTRVQGDAAPGLIAKALNKISSEGWAELAVLIRGGGSIEDLWAFNEEVVAKAIFECAVPVLTGVGHEVDTTIADLTADRRAATPSHAAQILWPERRTLVQAVDELEIDLTRSFADLVERKQTSLDQYGRALNWLSPVRRIERAHEALARETRAMVSAAAVLAERKARALDTVTLRLDMAFGPPAIEAQVRNLGDLEARLCRAVDGMAARKEQTLALAESGLSAMNPLGPLDRGYALVTMQRTGRFLRSVREAGPGDELDIRVSDGSLPATVAQRQDHE